jgi:hypothetical protein
MLSDATFEPSIGERVEDLGARRIYGDAFKEPNEFPVTHVPFRARNSELMHIGAAHQGWTIIIYACTSQVPARIHDPWWDTRWAFGPFISVHFLVLYSQDL